MLDVKGDKLSFKSGRKKKEFGRVIKIEQAII